MGGADGEVTGGCSPCAAVQLLPTRVSVGAAVCKAWKVAAAADAAPAAATPGVTRGVAGLMVALAVRQQGSWGMCSTWSTPRLRRMLDADVASTV